MQNEDSYILGTYMTNLFKRTISGVIYVVLIIACLLAGPDWFMWLSALFVVLAMVEFQMLTGASVRLFDFRPESRQVGKMMPILTRLLDVTAGASLCVATYDPLQFLVGGLVILAAYMVIRLTMALYDRSEDAFVSVCRSILSVMYIAFPMSLAALTDRLGESTMAGKHLVLIMFIMIWLNDTGAYCVGSLIGKHKLFPRLSPKKSWEGFFGGLIFCIIAGVVCFSAHHAHCHHGNGYVCLSAWVGLGIIVCLFSTWGDLFESLIKRTLNVKDSGRLIPGHGGILDRIDSLLLVAPATALYGLIVGMI